MPYEVRIDPNDLIVVARVFGSASTDEHRNAFEEALRSCTEHGIVRLLVDLRDLETEGIVTTTKAYTFGESMARETRLRTVRIAHVLPENADARAQIEFISTVASNRGRMAREFTSLHEARRWLLRAGGDEEILSDESSTIRS